MIPLRPYQEQGLAAVEQFIAKGGKRPLLAWATGLGKTILFAHWVLKRGGRALVIAHRDELIQQAAEKIGMVDPEADIGIVKAEADAPDAAIVIASIQTLARSPHRLLAILSCGALQSAVVDEAHHSEAPSYQRVLARLPMPVLGVTATPSRGDGKPLGKTWGKIVHSVSILQGIQQGYLCDLWCERVRLDVDLSTVSLVNDDFDAGELEHVLLDADVPRLVAQAIKTQAPNRKVLVFTPGVQSAYDTAAELRELGIAAAAIRGEVSSVDRHALLQKFREGTLSVICNCNVLTEGFDEPSINCIVIARPTRSAPFYVQMVGRGTRLSPGKLDCLVLDCVDAAFAHDLVTLPDIFLGEAGRAFADRIAEAVTVQQALNEAAEGTLKVETVPILRQSFSWVKAGPAWVLSIGNRSWLQLIEIGDKWLVETVMDGGTRIETIWEGPTLEYAQGIAEDEMRKHGAERLVDVNASWRRAPISEGQRRWLQMQGIPYPPTMRRGEASDLMTKLIASKAARLRKAALQK